MPRRHSDNKSESKRKINSILLSLGRKKDSTKINAIKELGLLGPSAFHVAEKLFPYLEHSNDDLRNTVMWALSSIGIGRPEVSEKLRQLLPECQSDIYRKGRIYWVLERIEGT